MKRNWFRLVICVVSRLGLLNFALSVVSSCHVVGPSVLQTGDHLSLECVAGVGQRTTEWTQKSSMDERSSITSNGNFSILTINTVTLNDSGKYRCICSGSDHIDHYVLVFEANIYASMIEDSCEVSVMLVVTAAKHEYFDRFNLSSFSCPTLRHSRIWKFPGVTNPPGYHVIHIFAVGESGGANHTCNVVVGYYPNGSNYTGNFSKTVGETSCNKEIAPAAKKHMSDGVPLTSGQERGASRAAQHSLLLMALILLCHTVNSSLN